MKNRVLDVLLKLLVKLPKYLKWSIHKDYELFKSFWNKMCFSWEFRPQLLLFLQSYSSLKYILEIFYFIYHTCLTSVVQMYFKCVPTCTKFRAMMICKTMYVTVFNVGWKLINIKQENGFFLAYSKRFSVYTLSRPTRCTAIFSKWKIF